MSAAGQAHVVSDAAVADERPAASAEAPTPREHSPAIPLLVLVVALAAAAVWFVAVPQFDKPVQVQRSCEVIVLESGNTRCVSNPQAGAKAAQKNKPAKQ